MACCMKTRHVCRPVFECGGSEVAGTLDNGTLRLVFNPFKLIVCSPAAVPTELFTRCSEVKQVFSTAVKLVARGVRHPV